MSHEDYNNLSGNQLTNNESSVGMNIVTLHNTTSTLTNTAPPPTSNVPAATNEVSVVGLQDFIGQAVKDSFVDLLQSDVFNNALLKKGVVFQQANDSATSTSTKRIERKRKLSMSSISDGEIEDEEDRPGDCGIAMSDTEEETVSGDDEGDVFSFITKKNESVGPEISKTLADSTNTALSTELDMKSIEGLCDDTIRPRNCGSLILPQLNPELRDSHKQKQLMKSQALAIKALTRGVILCDKVGKCKKEGKSLDAKEFATDMRRLVALQVAVVNSLNYRRMEEVREKVDEKYAKLVCKPFATNPKDSTDTSLLCGTELGKEMESIDKAAKVGHAMGKKKGVSTHSRSSSSQQAKYAKNSHRPQSATWHSRSGARQQHKQKKTSKNVYKAKPYRREHQQY